LTDLIGQHSDDGHVARHLIEKAERVERVFERQLDSLFDEVYGGAATAWALAGRSFVISGYFAEGASALETAVARGAERETVSAWISYARGMAAYMQGDYAESVDHLEAWARASERGALSLVEQACAAMSQIEHLVVGEQRDVLMQRAESLVADLKPAARG
jgi:hypothetical protein